MLNLLPIRQSRIKVWSMRALEAAQHPPGRRAPRRERDEWESRIRGFQASAQGRARQTRLLNELSGALLILGLVALGPLPLLLYPSVHNAHPGAGTALPPNNSMEPPALRSGDLRPIPASQVFGFGAILALGWPGGSPRGRWAALDRARAARHVHRSPLPDWCHNHHGRLARIERRWIRGRQLGFLFPEHLSNLTAQPCKRTC